MSNKTKLAIIAPSQKAYSETFIQAQKNNLNADVSYYYGGKIPRFLEGKEDALTPGVKRFYYHLVRKITKDDSLIRRKAFEKSLKNNRIEVVLAQYGQVGNAVLPIVKELNLPLIVHFHGSDASQKSEIEANNNYRDIFEYSVFIIAVSKVMYQQLLSLGCPEHKLILNTYGPHKDFYQLAPTLVEELFVGIGRFVDKKAPYYTIAAFKKVVEEYPKAQLMIGGDGILLNTCRNLVKMYGLENNVFFLGVITPKVFQDLILKARAFVQHSIIADSGDMEGTPLAVLETSSAGLPVISTNHAGIPDVILHGITGLLVDEHDVDGMAENMLKVLRDKEFAMKLGMSGKKHIQRNFSMDRYISELDNLIDKAKKKHFKL